MLLVHCYSVIHDMCCLCIQLTFIEDLLCARNIMVVKADMDSFWKLEPQGVEEKWKDIN